MDLTCQWRDVVRSFAETVSLKLTKVTNAVSSTAVQGPHFRFGCVPCDGQPSAVVEVTECPSLGCAPHRHRHPPSQGHRTSRTEGMPAMTPEERVASQCFPSTPSPPLDGPESNFHLHRQTTMWRVPSSLSDSPPPHGSHPVLGLRIPSPLGWQSLAPLQRDSAGHRLLATTAAFGCLMSPKWRSKRKRRESTNFQVQRKHRAIRLGWTSTARKCWLIWRRRRTTQCVWREYWKPQTRHRPHFVASGPTRLSRAKKKAWKLWTASTSWMCQHEDLQVELQRSLSSCL